MLFYACFIVRVQHSRKVVVAVDIMYNFVTIIMCKCKEEMKSTRVSRGGSAKRLRSKGAKNHDLNKCSLTVFQSSRISMKNYRDALRPSKTKHHCFYTPRVHRCGQKIMHMLAQTKK